MEEFCNSPRRINVVYKHNQAKSAVIALPNLVSWENLLVIVTQQLNLPIKRFFNSQNVEVKSVNVIRDNDLLYATESEAEDHQCISGWISLNVGGKVFTTTRSTLIGSEPNSMLARMFSTEEGGGCRLCTGSQWSHHKDAAGAVLIDRSPGYFEPLLNFLRHGQLIINTGLSPQGVLEEAKFYGISSIVKPLEEIIAQQQPPGDFSPIGRREFVSKLMSTPTNCVMRCQGLNFAGADLSKLDLRYVNFKHANMVGVNLSGANLSYANLERADLTRATLDGATLSGVKMICAQLEGASMLGADFEDTAAGTRANMEGASMKGVQLDDSRMAGINLRVATIKNSTLRNCDLRSAVLAGADLENSDLSGCDLQEANLRGANLKGANLKLMLNPLHMSCMTP